MSKPSLKNFLRRNVLPDNVMLKEIADKQNLNIILILALSKTFTLSGYDPLNQTMDGVSLLAASRPSEDGSVLPDEIRLKAQAWGNNFNNPTALIASFLGLPTNPPIKQKGKFKEVAKLKWKDIGKSFVGIDQTRNPLKIAGITLWNTIKMPFKLARNILRVFTEFLPRVIEDSSKLAIAKSQKKIRELDENYEASQTKKMGFLALNILAHIPYFGGKIWRLLGRAITSPGDSILAALKSAEEIGGLPGKIIAGILAVLSIAITITAYTVLLPLTLANAGSAIASLANLTNAIPYGSNVASGFNSAMNAVGETTLHALDPLMSSAGLEASAALAGAATTAALIGSPVSRFIDNPKKAIKKGLKLLSDLGDDSLPVSHKKEAIEMEPMPTKSFNERKIEELLGTASHQESDELDAFLSKVDQAIEANNDALTRKNENEYHTHFDFVSHLAERTGNEKDSSDEDRDSDGAHPHQEH